MQKHILELGLIILSEKFKGVEGSCYAKYNIKNMLKDWVKIAICIAIPKTFSPIYRRVFSFIFPKTNHETFPEKTNLRNPLESLKQNFLHFPRVTRDSWDKPETIFYAK